MASNDRFWVLEQLSNQQLLDSLGTVLRSERQALAKLIAHLGEVEERRLHLEAAHGSMFDYCVRRLGMSEDEACRRIDLARLARRFPAFFPLLATGDISLSVALVLKPVLNGDNHLELLATARGKSIRQARELVAARFPSADVPSNVRKLPDGRCPTPGDTAPLLTANRVHEPSVVPDNDCGRPVPAELHRTSSAVSPGARPSPIPPEEKPGETCPLLSPAPPDRPPSAKPTSFLGSPRPAPNSRIEPLSAQRYRVQFTADADSKRKLEQARDLLRHAHPNGDFGPIISRALDLLIADLLRQRFGVGARPKPSPRKPQRPGASAAGTPAPTASSASVGSSAGAPTLNAGAATSVPPLPEPTVVAKPAPAGPPSSRAVRRDARRSVVERDGLACTWVGADGTRCDSRAWLEVDHRHPRGKGGGSDASNLRILCRAHNRFAAEQEYGRTHIERAVSARQRQQARAQSTPPGDIAPS